MTLMEFRKAYHDALCQQLIRVRKGKKELTYPNFADGDNRTSCLAAWGIVKRLGYAEKLDSVSGQTSGNLFEQLNKDFLEAAFGKLHHLRPGTWRYSTNRLMVLDDAARKKIGRRCLSTLSVATCNPAILCYDAPRQCLAGLRKGASWRLTWGSSRR